MADVVLYKGGTPEVKYMWCENDYAQFNPPFGRPNLKESPPYDSHMDGAYGSGLAYFTMGMPVRPNNGLTGGMLWQKKALADKDPQVDDFIDLLVIPQNHYVTSLNFKIMESDAHMAGASVTLSARELKSDGKGGFTLTEISDVEDALTAQSVTTPIPIDKPCNVYVSLVKTDTGYAVPLYANPTIPAADDSSVPTYGRDIIIGVKVVALPTDSRFKLHNMLNGWYLSAKVAGFECPTYY